MAETNFLIPDGQSGIPVGALPFLNNNNGGFLGGNGLGAGLVGFLIGALINNGNGGLFGGGNNQMSDLVIQAVNNNGERMMRRDGDWDNDMPRGRYGY